MLLAVDSIVYYLRKLWILFLVVGDDLAARYVGGRLLSVLRRPVVVPTDEVEWLAVCYVAISARSVDLGRYYSFHDELFRTLWLKIFFVVGSGVVRVFSGGFAVFQFLLA